MSDKKDNSPSDVFVKITNAFNKLNFIDCQKSADTNDSDGIFWLGYCYEYGIGVEKDENRAFIHYQKSAEMNYPNGMYQVGYYYFLGIGVEIDKYKAFVHYLKSAEAGNAMGIFKTAICYKYGIGVEKNEDKFNYWIKRDPASQSEKNGIGANGIILDRASKFGKCEYCNEYNTWNAWCQTCDPDITIREWTSGNKDIDNYMKGIQLRVTLYERMIEWIPFNRLNNIKKIGEGGFGSVFSATWLDGIRKIKKIKKTDNGVNDNVDGEDNYLYVRAREPSSTVALKTLPSSRENPLGFLKEFDNFTKCRLYGSSLGIYGLTHNSETNEYLMVFQYANNGNLHMFLRTKFRDLTWQIKLKILHDISYDLNKIHQTGYVHADFHSGNILQDEDISKGIESYISDLGLSKETDENNSEGCIYGVLPYVAPEILLGQKFTSSADVYGFGIIMSEMSTGQRPFDGLLFDLSLSLDICKGLRPEFSPGTPECYIELAKQCMDSDPQKRPTAYDIWRELRKWNKNMMDSDDANEIKNQFLDADKIVKELPIIPPKHSESIYTSKIINTQRILSAIKAPLPSKPIDSVEVPIDC